MLPSRVARRHNERPVLAVSRTRCGCYVTTDTPEFRAPTVSITELSNEALFRSAPTKARQSIRQ